MPPLTIVFDFGGVLIDWDPCYLYCSFFGGDRRAAESFLAEIDFNKWNRDLDLGRPFAEVIAEVSRRFPAYRALIQAYSDRYEETLAGPIQPSVDILRALRDAGHPLYGLTNWPMEKFIPVRRKYSFFNWFEDIVVSGEVNLAKPDPRIFVVLLERIGRPPGECLFVDDSFANITSARDLGFQTIHFESAGQLEAELRGRGLLMERPRS